MRGLKTMAKRGWRAAFEVGQRLGVNVLPAHFYSETPNIRVLRADRGWRAPMTMIGVAGADITGQTAAFTALWDDVEPVAGVHAAAVAANGQGGGYGEIEADVLFAFVRTRRPKRIVQIGCGVSTAVIMAAAEGMAGAPHVVCIEPFPSDYLAALARRGGIELIDMPAQSAPREVLTSLDPGDLFFIDSTHCVRPGGEVNRLVLDILPRLNDGVSVHFHDIYFPYDYQRGILSHELFFHNESTLLHAFLVNNRRYRIDLSLSMLHYAAPDVIQAKLPHYTPQPAEDGLSTGERGHFPSATYLLSGPAA